MTLTAQPSALPTIDRDLLATATGGDGDDGLCTADNPTGAPSAPTQFFENDHSGPTIDQRVMQSTDRALAPWQALNDVLGGFAAGSPRQGSLPASRPTLR